MNKRKKRITTEETSEVSNGGNTSLWQYLQDARKVPLLTRDEERTLAKKVKEGDAIAREHFILANLTLVIKIAKDYEHFGLPILDLINEGNDGLMEAVKRYNPDNPGKAKFSTYAVFWIKQRIKKAMSRQLRSIRIPSGLHSKIKKIKEMQEHLYSILGCEPTNAEIAEELGITEVMVAKRLEADTKTFSLQAPLSDKHGSDVGSVEDIVPDNALTPDQYAIKHEEVEGIELDVAFDSLDSRQLMIINARFGIDGEPPQTLEEVGVKFGVTRERIRQIQNKALEQMRKKLAVRRVTGLTV
ncbi:MAG: RNA polymerase sigma factor RpoD/SigA [Candidatus Taylorbacteria bacterium]|nr:RNA polymerase sigma factor RpoD/SigA [Candidatus Taylorbacteria bacterium]